MICLIESFSLAGYCSIMDMEVGNLNTYTSVSLTDQAHVWRSRMLDAFATLESNVARLLAKSDKVLVSENAPLGQKIEALKKLALNPAPTKNCAAKLEKICLELCPYLSIRSDVVHAKIAVFICDSVVHTKFCNSINDDKPYPPVRLLTFEDFDAINKEVRRLSNQLSQILNPPSSPPQPKRGAASGL